MTVSSLYSQTDSTDCVFRIDTVTGKKVYSTVDKMPEPVGGQKVLLKKLGQEIKLGNVSEDMLTGEVPSPINPPKGCNFNPRCPFVKEICKKKEPVLKQLDDGRLISCHLY